MAFDPLVTSKQAIAAQISALQAEGERLAQLPVPTTPGRTAHTDAVAHLNVQLIGLRRQLAAIVRREADLRAQDICRAAPQPPKSLCRSPASLAAASAVRRFGQASTKEEGASRGPQS